MVRWKQMANITPEVIAKRPIIEILEEAKTIDPKKISSEILNWLIHTVILFHI